MSSAGSESPALSSLSLDSLVAPDTPIQFDIISPVSEEYAGQAKSAGQGGRFVSGNTRRHQHAVTVGHPGRPNRLFDSMFSMSPSLDLLKEGPTRLGNPETRPLRTVKVCVASPSVCVYTHPPTRAL